MRTNVIHGIFTDLKLPFLCKLSWLHFDGVEVEGPVELSENQTFFWEWLGIEEENDSGGTCLLPVSFPWYVR
jgi:hypothetical protein